LTKKHFLREYIVQWAPEDNFPDGSKIS